MNAQRLIETEHQLALADRVWRAEVRRLHGPDGVLLHGYGPLGMGEPGTRQRAAYEVRRVAIAAWRQVRARGVSAM
ncbi:hypothetical protein LRS73_33855 (plasmid) [Methylobacterium currus]|uniref:hypothetical protein n=1 Tax=Methylobacterium currus TaxID=2051553 RepID=UPI001E4A95F4|nr:hypothetical protein [Methylobacterium currus]UHC19969.1 hypothetical protein LRS73_33855 [Methylobacterium currus]